jgi:hypothetical protein
VVPPATGPGHGVLHAANLTTVGEAAYEAMRREGLAFAGETGTAYLETDNRIRSGDEPALEEAVRTYAGAERVLSSRLHGCILALAVGRPVLTVSGDRKIEAFMEAAGLADWVLDQADLAPLPALLRDLPSQPSARSFVKTAVAVHRDVAREVREALR